MRHATKFLAFLFCSIAVLSFILAVSAAELRDHTVTVVNNYEDTVTFAMQGIGTFVLGHGEQVTFMQYEGDFLYTVTSTGGAMLASVTQSVTGGTTTILLGTSGGPGGSDGNFFTVFSWDLVIFYAVTGAIGLIVLVMLVQSVKIKYYRGRVNKYKTKEREGKLITKVKNDIKGFFTGEKSKPSTSRKVIDVSWTPAQKKPSTALAVK